MDSSFRKRAISLISGSFQQTFMRAPLYFEVRSTHNHHIPTKTGDCEGNRMSRASIFYLFGTTVVSGPVPASGYERDRRSRYRLQLCPQPATTTTKTTLPKQIMGISKMVSSNEFLRVREVGGRIARTSALLILAVLLLFPHSQAVASPVTLDFEGFADSTSLTNQYSGLSFSNASS